MAKKKKMQWLNMAMFWLVIVGGINWGLKVFDFDLVKWFANLVNFAMLSDIIYGLVGLSALFLGVRALMRKIMFR